MPRSNRDEWAAGRSVATSESVAASAVTPPQTRAMAAQLAQLFANFDTSAVTFVEENEASLRPPFDSPTWDRFLRLTQGFSFPEAAALLEKTLALFANLNE